MRRKDIYIKKEKDRIDQNRKGIKSNRTGNRMRRKDIANIDQEKRKTTIILIHDIYQNNIVNRELKKETIKMILKRGLSSCTCR